MRASLLVLVGLLMLPVMAMSRDFDEPPEPIVAQLPRSGPLFFSIGLGVDFLYARWRELNPSLRGESLQAGPALRLRAGLVLREGLATFVEGYATAPVLPPLTGLEEAGVGVGSTWFVRPYGPWHLDLAVRRAWAHRSEFASTGIGLNPPAVETFRDIWFAEVGVGHAGRSRHLDGGWTLAIDGGLADPTGSSGWGIGLGLSYFWSSW